DGDTVVKPAPRSRPRPGRGGDQPAAGGPGGARLPAKRRSDSALRRRGLHRLAGARRRRSAAWAPCCYSLDVARSAARLWRRARSRAVVVDGNIFTGGGVTAGIDVALTVASEIAGRAAAEAIQLGIEYA